MTLNRRRFITQSIAATACATVAPTFVCASRQSALPIVDTHQHLWDLSLFKPPWLATAPPVIAEQHVTADYLKATEGLNVVKAVYMEVDVAPSQQVQEAKHVIGLCKSDLHPTVAAVISGRPNSDGFAKYIGQFQDSPYIKGVRQVLQVPGTPAGYCLQPQFVKSVQLLGEMGMSFDLCMRPRELADGLRLAKQCPDTRFIVDHCGNADPKAFKKSESTSEPWHDADGWKRDIEALGKNDRVVCKISGIVARAPQGWQPDDLVVIINHCLDSFGPDRVMFGSDWPVCKLGGSLKQWVDALKVVIADRPLADQKKLLHDNASAFYGLA